MSAAYNAALLALADARVRMDSADPSTRQAALVALDDALDVLAAEPHRLRTGKLAARVAALDRQMASMTAEDRNRAIAVRLGISRSRVYQLRAVHKRLDGNHV